MALARLFDNFWGLVLLLLMCATLTNAALPMFATGMTPQQEQWVKAAFEGAVTLARIVALKFEPACDPYLGRFFAPSDATFVEHMFRTIADVPLDLDMEDVLSEEVEKFVASLKPDRMNSKFKTLSIAYGNHPALSPELLDKMPGKCADGVGVQAYLNYNLDDPSIAWMSLCPYLFETYYSLQDTQNPPDELIKKGIPGLTCDGLGNIETNYMHTTGAAVLHELFHWPYLFMDVPKYGDKIRSRQNHHMILDYSSVQRPEVTEDNPETGYNAYHTRQLRSLPNDQAGYVEALNNADSYASYASSRTWGLICNKFFNPAISVEDWRRRRHPDSTDDNSDSSVWGSSPESPAGKVAEVEEIHTDEEEEELEGCFFISTSSSNWAVCY